MNIGINKNLGLLLSGQLVSQVGDKFYLLALSYWVLKVTGSPAKMGIVLACSLIPSLVMGFVSGAFVDRYDRKTIIIGTDIIRGLIIAFVAIAYYMGFLNFTILIITQLLLSLNTAFFDPAIPSIIIQMVRKDQLAKANSLTEFIRGISTIIGPVLGGIAVAGFGYFFAFSFNALSFLASAFFEWFIKVPPLKRDHTVAVSIKKDIIDGYKYIIRDKGLLVILFIIGIIHFFVGSIEVIIPVLAESVKGDGAQNLGFLQTAFGVGALTMALTISFLNINRKEVKLLFTSVFLVGMGYSSMAILQLSGVVTLFPFLLAFLTFGWFIILAATCFKTILQKNIDTNMAGRVFGVVSSVGNGSIPLAMLTYGILLSFIDMNYLVLFSGAVLMILSIFFGWRYSQSVLKP